MLILFMRVGGLVVSNINSKRATALCIITEGKKNFNMKSPIKLEFCFVLLVSFAGKRENLINLCDNEVEMKKECM